MTKQEEIRSGVLGILQLHGMGVLKSVAAEGDIYKYLHSQDVVIKVDRELPRPKHVTDETWEWMNDFLIRTRKEFIKAGYVAVEPLREVE